MVLPEGLARHAQPRGLLLQATTGSTGVAGNRPPEPCHLPDIAASLNYRMGREREEHRHGS